MYYILIKFSSSKILRYKILRYIKICVGLIAKYTYFDTVLVSTRQSNNKAELLFCMLKIVCERFMSSIDGLTLARSSCVAAVNYL